MLNPLFLWLLPVFFLWKYFQASPAHPKQIFNKFESKKNNKKTSLIKKIAQNNLFDTPGYIVNRWVIKSKYCALIQSAGKPINFSELQTLKQTVISLGNLYFWIYILFGDITLNTILQIAFMILVGFFLPDLWLKSEVKKRTHQFIQDVPYFVDMCALLLGTGLNIEQTLRAVANQGNGKLHKTIQKKIKSLEYGLPLAHVLEELRTSTPVPEFQNFCSSILQAQKLGASLSRTLEIQSQLIRTRQRQKAEELSRTAAVKISLPLVFFIFPALLIIYIGPGVLHLVGG